MRANPSESIATAVHGALAARSVETIDAALRSVHPEDLAVFFHTSLDDVGDATPIGAGLPASPGAARGRIVLSADAAIEAAASGEDVILVRPETSLDDVVAMQAAKGIVTHRGGLVSHAAVVARGWGIPAVVGAADVHIAGTTVTIGSTVLEAGEVITIDGSTGNIYLGALDTFGSVPPPELDTLLAWADDVSRGHIQVRANADTADDATFARRLGAQGIGLCRTEHMFLAADRLPIMRRLILSHDPATQAAALGELEEAQISDFEAVLEAMDGLPVTVRLLDPPLHEFLPDLLDLVACEARGELDDAGCAELAAVRRLHETNPMIGTRGVRLGVLRPGLYEMQVRALCAAAAHFFERGMHPHVEVMIPLVVDAEELRIARSWVTGVLDEIGHPELASNVVTVGAMIETPRAALTAGALAEHADFFSFGTNDLTQMTFAFSRDDVEARLLPAYQALGILPANPFAVLDQDGVGELIRIACELARSTRPNIELGACGEHTGHTASADFLVRQGVDSVSCSPFRVPMARLAVAQALLDSGRVRLHDVQFRFDEPVAASSDDVSAHVDDASVGAIDETLVLHVLRIRGFATPDGLAASLGAHPADLLDQMVASGLVRFVEARSMYGLLPDGKLRQEALLDSYATDTLRAALKQPYLDFLMLNDAFKSLCTTWQMRDDLPNDHSDADYDFGCIERLEHLNADAQPVIAAFATAEPRLARYGPRLTSASTRVAGGETKQFTGVMCESFHDVWMELHEDLIVLQRIDRTHEGSF
ncbi:MAG TPA: putative PEP-binding protein [Ilumatobacteraceae bacterium]|nr:putative PEP-binding protein [Ilumatobacteraceae bacterium]